jgi:hypothetical protein
VKRAAILVVAIASLAPARARARAGTTISAPYESATFAGSCAEPLPIQQNVTGNVTSSCENQHAASTDGNIAVDTSVTSLADGAAPGTGLASDEAEIDDSYELTEPARAIVFTADVTIASASASADGWARSVFGPDRPYPFSSTYPIGTADADVSAFLSAAGDACGCGTSGREDPIATTYAGGPVARSNERVSWRFALTGKNGAALAPQHFSLAFIVQTWVDIEDAGRARARAVLTLDAIRIDLIK